MDTRFKTLLLAVIVFLLLILYPWVNLAFGQQKVANYSYRKAGSSSYEHLDFWVKGDKRGEVTYAYGSDRKEVKLAYLGSDRYQGSACFTVQFPNQYTLYIIPQDASLEVRDGSGKYTKRFNWEYEEPVDGIGTFCQVCAEDENEAIKLIWKYFMKSEYSSSLRFF